VDRHELLVLITNGVDYEDRLKRTGRERRAWEGRAALTPNGGEALSEKMRNHQIWRVSRLEIVRDRQTLKVFLAI